MGRKLYFHKLFTFESQYNEKRLVHSGTVYHNTLYLMKFSLVSILAVG